MLTRVLQRAALAMLFSTASAAAEPEPPPQVVFADLFVAVQTAHVFADGKVFADAVPRTAPDRILADYHAQGPATPQALLRFVETHFSLPPGAVPAAAYPGAESITEHIDRLWQELTRTTTAAPAQGSLLTLPNPYVVPGGRFRELYYWDSYFTMLGLVQSGRQDLSTPWSAISPT